MNICRFEDRLAGQARVLTDLRERITACRKEELAEAFARIEAARKRGEWVALLLDYELGEWFEPTLDSEDRTGSNTMRPLLTALAYGQMTIEQPWSDSPENHARVAAMAPLIERDDYIGRIKRIREWIRQGDVYQVNATFPMQVEIEGDSQSLYKKIANKHPVSYAAYIEDNDRTVLSFSPELFLLRQGDTLTTKPMKGTAPRSTDPGQDRLLGENLLRSAKNRAENLMIVDLLRNDLGRVALPGTVVARPLFSLEQYPSVWTMTSTVTANLKPDTTFEAILRALFPCGSVTGAPKIAAMQRIRQTEPEQRGLYCGSIGWMAPNGDFALNVAIRTLVIRDHGATYNVGGGIVFDSDPSQEWEECHWKSRVLSNNPPELIETMLADENGKIERLEEHLNRLEKSSRQLNYACPERSKLKNDIRENVLKTIEKEPQPKSNDTPAIQSQRYRVRLLLERSGHVSIESARLADLTAMPLVSIATTRLNSHQALLRHKTTYRPWYADTTGWLTKHPEFFDLLFLNEREELCEGSRSNVYIEKNGEWITPPLECGLLGGAVRQHLLATGQVKQGVLTLEDLHTPGARVRLSNGLRGWFDVSFRDPSLLPGDFLP